MLKFFKIFVTIRLQWRFWILCWFWKQYWMDFVIRYEKTRKKYYGGEYNLLPSKTTVYLLDWNNSCWLFIFSKWFPNHPIRSISRNRLLDNNRIRQGCRNIWVEYHYWCMRRMTHNFKLCAVLHPIKIWTENSVTVIRIMLQPVSAKDLFGVKFFQSGMIQYQLYTVILH